MAYTLNNIKKDLPKETCFKPEIPHEIHEEGFEINETGLIQPKKTNSEINKLFFQLLDSIDSDKPVKLFNVDVTSTHKEIIENTIKLRNIVTKDSNLPSFFERNNQLQLDVKSIASEVVFTSYIKKMNVNYRYKLQSPELATMTPSKLRPDYILSLNNFDLIFDMKSQCNSKKVNINKIAHDRGIENGLQFYVAGFVNSDNLENLTKIAYFLIPLNFDLFKLIDKGQYIEKSSRNIYYQIDISDHYK